MYVVILYDNIQYNYVWLQTRIAEEEEEEVMMKKAEKHLYAINALLCITQATSKDDKKCKHYVAYVCVVHIQLFSGNTFSPVPRVHI
jgi:hypothetical protein